MKIAQIVTLVSPDGAYGGPVRVAVNQLVALKAAGHDVTLFTTHRGYETPPTEVEGVPLVSYQARTVVPKVGFAGLASPALMARLRRDLAGFDVAHVHLARDLVTLPAAWLALRIRIPLTVQTHGMIDPSSNALARPLDAALTRPILRRASSVFHLTSQEKTDLAAVSRGAGHLVRLINGVPRTTLRRTTEPPFEVLFLARLHPRKRATIFVKAALQLAPQFPDVTFALVGPDEGEGREIQDLLLRAGSPSRVRWEGALPPEQTLERMARAGLFVLPSVNEPFPMSALEAASVGCPLIITDSCGLAEPIRQHEAGLIIDDSQSALEDAITHFLEDQQWAALIGSNARAMTESHFSMEKVADTLLVHYERAIQDASSITIATAM